MKKLYFLYLFFYLVSTSNAQLTGVNPNQCVNGQNLQTTITGNGIFLQNSSPAGNLFQIRLIDGSNIITGFYYPTSNNGTLVLNSNTVTTEFTIPFTSPPGDYDLEVITGDAWNPNINHITYTLPDAVTILPSQGFITGKVYMDLNFNGIFDVGEPGVQNYAVKLNPQGFVQNTGVGGVYSFPVQNGSYTVNTLTSPSFVLFSTAANDTFSVTINNSNSSANDFGLESALLSVSPSVAYKGIASLHVITANRPIFHPGANPYGNVNNIRIYSSPNYVVQNNVITVIDSFTVQVLFNVPASTAAGSNLDIRVVLNSGYIGNHTLVQQFDVDTPSFFIFGTAFFDLNQNKIYDVTDPKLNNAKFQLSPDSTIVFTDTSGQFIFGSQGGPHILSHFNNIPGLTLFTDSATYNFTATSNLNGKDFGFISTLPDYFIEVKDLSVFARCNSSQYASFKIRNTSNTTYDVVAWLKASPNMNYISSLIPPSSISNDTIYWTISNMLPYSEVNIKALFGLPGAGSSISFSAKAVSYNGSGISQLSDQSNYFGGVFCAFDPNDKQVTPPGILTENFTLMADTLEYLIRFQNTGNDTAFNVIVLDTLDNNLDYSTFEVLASSHSVQTEQKSNGAVKFSFINILLVDSVTNEPESHGYIRYRIQGQTGLPDSTEITNTAYIYFDFNPAVVTNTTLNTLVFVLPVGLNEIENDNNVLIYPNPFNETATMSFENLAADNYSLVISDITSKQVSAEQFTNGTRFIIEGSKLSDGMYFYILTNTHTKSQIVGKFVVR